MTCVPHNGVYRIDRPEAVRDAARARGLEVTSIEVSNTGKGELLSAVAEGKLRLAFAHAGMAKNPRVPSRWEKAEVRLPEALR